MENGECEKTHANHEQVFIKLVNEFYTRDCFAREHFSHCRVVSTHHCCTSFNYQMSDLVPVRLLNFYLNLQR